MIFVPYNFQVPWRLDGVQTSFNFGEAATVTQLVHSRMFANDDTDLPEKAEGYFSKIMPGRRDEDEVACE